MLKKRNNIIFLFILIFIAGCSHTQHSKDDFIANSYKTLSSTYVVYETTMKSVGNLYSQEKITEKEKENVIKYANQFIASYKDSVDALIEYKSQPDSELTSESISAILSNFDQTFVNFINITTNLMDTKEK